MIAAPAELMESSSSGSAAGACLVQPYLGMAPTRGCSTFLFVPGTSDCHMLLLRTEETHDDQLRTYASVIDLESRVLMSERLLRAARKYEGVGWVDRWPARTAWQRDAAMTV